MRYTHAQLSWLVDHGFFTAALRGLAEPPLDAGETGLRELLLALATQGRGEVTAAREIILPVARQPGRVGEEAFYRLVEAEHLLGKPQAMLELLDAHPDRGASARGMFLRGRALGTLQPDAALDLLLKLADQPQPTSHLQRLAAFEAVPLLDRLGRFDEALAWARRFHGAFRDHAAAGHFLQHLDTQRQRVREARPRRDQNPGCTGTALIVGLPRSGTTLLAQMLDAHPEIHAIGEFDGLGEVLHTMTSQGVSPYRFSSLPPSAAAALRKVYLEGARWFSGDGCRWTLDKSLLTWHSIPVVADLLPGARLLYLKRDPRDTATSILLSGFPSAQYPWSTRLDHLFEVLRRAHELIPLALAASGLPTMSIRYEDLVGSPGETIRQCAHLLGIQPVEALLQPENNPRAVTTLSHAQIRRPIHRGAVGRWRNYAGMFGPEWHQLAERAGY